MKFTQVCLVALGLTASQVLAALRPEIKGAEVVELEPGQTVTADTKEIPTKMSPKSSIEFLFRCASGSGTQFTVSGDKKFVACCLPGQNLVGSPDTEMHCCGAGHDVAGSKEAGYSCCPTGHTFDGKVCQPPPQPPSPDKVCSNGKQLVNGECVCPSGMVEGPDGWCTVSKCSSGIQAGKCYTFTFENGYRYGYNTAGWYTASRESRAQQFGKFKMCKDADCSATGDVNPGEGVRLKDIHGQANGGQNPNFFLNDAQNGGHIGKVADYNKAGVFTLTKWPCGKYCLGGLSAGIGPTCPSELPAATFTSFDKQSCIPIDVMEVPCDIHAKENNCIWKNGADQCCDKVDCSAHSKTIPAGTRFSVQ